jgi:hypothetical protein
VYHEQYTYCWYSADPITWVESPYDWIGIDIFHANTGLYASQTKLEEAALVDPLVVGV